MFSFDYLLLFALALLIAGYWWQSGVYKGRARELAVAHCREQDLQLLDQSMVIIGIWPVRGADGRLALRRRYQFEFASTGDRRYQGRLELLGLALQKIELEAYKLPDQD